MKQSLALTALLVRDYDEAIAFFTNALGFTLFEDTDLGGGKRWVVVAPQGATESRLLLAQASGEDQAAVIGRQGGGRVFLFLNTDDIARDVAAWSAKGVTFVQAPVKHPYGTVAVFEDLYGNRWDLIEPA